MVSTQKLMVSTAYPVKTTEEISYTSSEHSADSEFGPWSVCSSTDMCTPMPHTTLHSINMKRCSDTSSRSVASATTTSAAFSEMEPMELYAHQSMRLPALSTTLTTPSNVSSHLTNLEAPLHHLTDLHTWSSGQPPATTAARTLNSGISDSSLAHNALNNWRLESVSRALFHGYHSAKPAAVHGAGEHSRSASHHSTTSSVDSWNSYTHNPFSTDTLTSLLPLATSIFHNGPSTDGKMYALPHAANFDPSNLIPIEAPSETLNTCKSSKDASSLLESFAPYSSAYTNYPLGLGANSLDPQLLMAYNAVFGAPPLMSLNGLTSDLLAARSVALAQLANAHASVQASITTPESAVNDGQNPGNKKTNLYKTELCRSWEEKGTCRYGSKCQFAHGQQELKNVNRHPKFKTEICRTFWIHGSCPYGKRCCFLHTTSIDSATQSAGDARDSKSSAKPTQTAHDPPTSRLTKRVFAAPLSATSPPQSSLAIPLSSPQLRSAPVTRSLSDFSHSRSNSNSSCSQSSDGSSHIDSLRIQIWPRSGAREQVPAQDAPGPRSRLQRLRPTEDYADSSSSLPSTSTLSTTRYSPFLDCRQPPHSAISDLPAILVRSSSQQMCKAQLSGGRAQPLWPLH